MIIGIGTDIIEIARISELARKYGAKFLDRIFTKAEQQRVEQRKTRVDASYAKLYAAKEAALKALGSGLGDGTNWHEVNVRYLPSGQPYITLSGRSQEIALAKALESSKIVCHTSLSDDETRAMACVVIEAIGH